MVSEKVLLHCCNIGICVFADSAIMVNRAFIRQQSEVLVSVLFRIYEHLNEKSAIG